MKKILYESNNNIFLYIKAFILEMFVTSISIAIFALIIYFTESGFEYAPIFATISIAIGSFLAAYYTAKKINNKGFLVGLFVGIITFILITVISLIIDQGTVTINTLFHFIIILLSSMIGGIIGVNKSQNKKFI